MVSEYSHELPAKPSEHSEHGGLAFASKPSLHEQSPAAAPEIEQVWEMPLPEHLSRQSSLQSDLARPATHALQVSPAKFESH